MAQVFSSNNPFRSGSRVRSSVYSPFDEDESADYFGVSPPGRSHSVGTPYSDRQVPRPFSFASSTEDLSSSGPSQFSRRQYSVPNPRSSYRRSTNPFVADDMRSPPPPPPPTRQPRMAPPRPSDSTKPSADGGDLPPPPYEESAENRDRLLVPEKSSSSSSSSSRDHRSASRDNHHSSSSSRRHESSSSHRHGSSSRHHHSSSSRRTKKKVHTDTIDKLDVTGIFGPGSFHHDGPFDACNPYRNKVKTKAPVMAFPADGANMTLSGGDSGDKYATENRILGRGDSEAYHDYAPPVGRQGYAGGKLAPQEGEDEFSFDTSKKAIPVHGDTTAGLGSSTFLDGTPAPRTVPPSNGGGASLGRKKSLVQKLRGASSSPAPPAPPRNYEPIARTTSNTTDDRNPSEAVKDGDLLAVPKEAGGTGLLRRVKSLKVSRRRS